LGFVESKDLNILVVSNLAMLAYYTAVQEKLIKKAEELNYREQLISIKESTLEYIRLNALEYNGTVGLIDGDFICTQTYSVDNIEDLNREALNNSLAIVNITSCLETIRLRYNISDINSLTISKTDIGSSIMTHSNNLTSKYVDINVYYPQNKQRLDLSACNGLKISTPVNDDIINSTLYDKFRNRSIDIYNPDDPIFTSRCYTYNQDGYDTTINMRRKYLYQNMSIYCNNNCTYIGMDENYYVQCACAGPPDDDYDPYTPGVVNHILNSWNSINIDIVKCTNQAFNVYRYLNIRERFLKTWAFITQ
jgi:hypothetical protein